MSNNINAEKLTKPIQLLAAWLVGLLSISSSFLIAAANIQVEWQSGVLVIAAVINVPLFLAAVFILQTKFRPELQEDSYYSTYLNSKTNTLVTVNKSEALINELSVKVEHLMKLEVRQNDNETSFNHIKFGINTNLADQENIREVLSNKSILEISVFGLGAEKPNAKVMAISIYIPLQIQSKLIELAREMNLDGYSFFDNIEEGTSEDVLIGSYGGVEHILIK